MVKIILCNYSMLFFPPGCSVDIKYIIIFSFRLSWGPVGRLAAGDISFILSLFWKHTFLCKCQSSAFFRRRPQRWLWIVRTKKLQQLHCSGSWAPVTVRSRRTCTDPFRLQTQLFDLHVSECFRPQFRTSLFPFYTSNVMIHNVAHYQDLGTVSSLIIITVSSSHFSYDSCLSFLINISPRISIRHLLVNHLQTPTSC